LRHRARAPHRHLHRPPRPLRLPLLETTGNTGHLAPARAPASRDPVQESSPATMARSLHPRAQSRPRHASHIEAPRSAPSFQENRSRPTSFPPAIDMVLRHARMIDVPTIDVSKKALAPTTLRHTP